MRNIGGSCCVLNDDRPSSCGLVAQPPRLWRWATGAGNADQGPATLIRVVDSQVEKSRSREDREARRRNAGAGVPPRRCGAPCSGVAPYAPFDALSIDHRTRSRIVWQHPALKHPPESNKPAKAGLSWHRLDAFYLANSRMHPAVDDASPSCTHTDPEIAEAGRWTIPRTSPIG